MSYGPPMGMGMPQVDLGKQQKKGKKNNKAIKAAYVKVVKTATGFVATTSINDPLLPFGPRKEFAGDSVSAVMTSAMDSMKKIYRVEEYAPRQEMPPQAPYPSPQQFPQGPYPPGYPYQPPIPQPPPTQYQQPPQYPPNMPPVGYQYTQTAPAPAQVQPQPTVIPQPQPQIPAQPSFAPKTGLSVETHKLIISCYRSGMTPEQIAEASGQQLNVVNLELAKHNFKTCGCPA